MISIISPAKTLDFETPSTTRSHTEPEFLEASQELIKVLRGYTPAALASLMGISEKLAVLNVERYQCWDTPFTPDNAKQAILAFRGDVYTGLEADNFKAPDFTFAQQHLRILSGLYGLLRPLDLIQPYRLEMGTSLPIGRQKDLYGFWNGRITDALNEALAESRSKTLVNLASNEYFKSVQPDRIDGEIITPVFKDWKNGKYKIISFFAKKARGMMVSYLVHQRLKDPAGLKAFDTAGYRFSEKDSQGPEWVFLRKA